MCLGIFYILVNLQVKANECSEICQQIQGISLLTFTTAEISSQVWKALGYISFDKYKSNFWGGHLQELKSTGKGQLGNLNSGHDYFWDYSLQKFSIRELVCH